MSINVSLTIICIISVLFATGFAYLGCELVDGCRTDAGFGLMAMSLIFGLFITHGEYGGPAYSWSFSYLKGDGISGEVVSGFVGLIVELIVAALPLIAGIGLFRMFGHDRKAS